LKIQRSNQQDFENYLIDTNEPGSGKAKSYIRAIELLEIMLGVESFGFTDCLSIYDVTQIKRLQELIAVVRNQQRNRDSSWLIDDIPESYLANGYCSAALGSYVQYLAEELEQKTLIEKFDSHDGSGSELAKKLDKDLVGPARFIQSDTTRKGEDVLRSVIVRRNQNGFRRMLSIIYGGECCITGLNIPELNIASHIVPWSENKQARLDPSNGLFLSRTYDAAFDRHLITLDEDFRVVVSKKIRDRYSVASIAQYFSKIEGETIRLPKTYQPDQKYLKKHRERLY